MCVIYQASYEEDRLSNSTMISANIIKKVLLSNASNSKVITSNNYKVACREGVGVEHTSTSITTTRPDS